MYLRVLGLIFSSSCRITGPLARVCQQTWIVDCPWFFTPFTWCWSQPLLSTPFRRQLQSAPCPGCGYLSHAAGLSLLTSPHDAPLPGFSLPLCGANKTMKSIFYIPGLHFLISCSVWTVAALDTLRNVGKMFWGNFRLFFILKCVSQMVLIIYVYIRTHSPSEKDPG